MSGGYDDEELDAWGRKRSSGGGRGRGRGRGRGMRRRPEDDLDMDILLADDSFRKRRRRNDLTRGGSGHNLSYLPPDAQEYLRQWDRQIAIMHNIADPSMPEAVIARNAFDKLDEMAVELGLSKAVVEIAHQAAEILMMMRADEDPSDFQDYTLVAIIAVAAHLGQHALGDRHGLPALAGKYRQKVDSLEQVFAYIMQSLSHYRETYLKIHQLREEGVFGDMNMQVGLC